METAVAQETVISVQGLEKVFKDFWGRPKVKAVKSVSFDLRRGEVFGLLGPNGAGKSTVIKMILGLLYPTAGQISVMGQSPKDSAGKKNIGFLPEETYLYPYLSARETLDFFGKLFGLDAKMRKERTQQLLEMLGMEHAADRKIGQFSKGMARRIGLAQALVNDPAIVILDEPTSGLDPLGRRKIKDLVAGLKEKGKTVLLSSHLLAEVEDVCDRVMIMYGGQILSSGSISSLIAENERVRLTMPRLDESALNALVAQAAQSAGTNDVVVDHPEISLESYFLKVIRAQMQKDGKDPEADKAQIAGFLSDEK